jgi:FkbM family methyltransferase
MARSVRRLLARMLGIRSYLMLVSRAYIMLVRLGIMRKRHPELYFLEHLVRPGAVCVDIGANLGYYTVEMSRRCGVKGRVYAVEPVVLFATVLRWNVAQFGLTNVIVVPYALGAEDRQVEMGTPEIEGVFRHGCTHVLEENHPPAAQTYPVQMRVPDRLFSDLDRLDFVKCDVEGYETEVFPHFTETLRRFRPIVQVEINTPQNRRLLFDLMAGLDYRLCRLEAERLVDLTPEAALTWEGHDFYFVPDDKADSGQPSAIS